VSILSQPSPVDLTYVETLRSFLTRPYPVLSADWTGDSTAGSLLVSFDPLKSYLNLPVITGKLQGFMYLRAGLRIEIRINGTRFHYGQMVAGFAPLDGSYQNYGATQLSAPSLTMFPSLTLDPGPSQVGVLEVPYVHPLHFMSLLGSDESRSIGKLHLKVLVPLRVVAETVVPRVNFTVYISLVQPVLNAFSATPLVTPLILEEQSNETSIRVTPEANNLMATDISDISFNMAMSGSNTIATSEQYIGVTRQDMQLDHIYTKPNFLRQFTWTTARAAAYQLSVFDVAPTVRPVAPHYLSNVSRLFQFWRGSLRYHVRVVASGFHSGRMLISWEPSSTYNSTDPVVTLSNRMSMVVDIQETTDVYFTIPYMSRRPWLRTDTSVGAPPA